MSGVAGPPTHWELGPELAHRLMVVQYLDTLQHEVTKAAGVRKDMETREVQTAISGLYSLSFTARGREALVTVLTMGRLTDCLLALIRHSSEDGKKDMKKSAIRGYASELLLLTVRASDSVTWLQRYCGQLLQLGRSDSHSKLAELVSWCAPLADPAVFTEAGLAGLLDTVRRSVGEGKETGGLDNELVTAVRVLRYQVWPAGLDRTRQVWRDSRDSGVVMETPLNSKLLVDTRSRTCSLKHYRLSETRLETYYHKHLKNTQEQFHICEMFQKTRIYLTIFTLKCS